MYSQRTSGQAREEYGTDPRGRSVETGTLGKSVSLVH